jgi:uncharacterized protein
VRRCWAMTCPRRLVATATAIALFVDAARLPVYLLTQGREISFNWPLVLIATAGVVLGTLLGRHVLARLSQAIFRRVIALLLIGLGVYMALRGLLFMRLRLGPTGT